jgi:hypothetical protein
MVDFDDMQKRAEDEQWAKRAEDEFNKSKFERGDEPRQDQMGQQDDAQGQSTQPNQQ